MSAHSQTPSQTIGPFFHDGLMGLGGDLAPEGAAGRRVRIEGRVLDGAAEPVDDAMVEVWQADGQGRYRHPFDGRSSGVERSFVGFGRMASGSDGTYRLDTVLPGTVPGRGGSIQAPHLNVQVFARGLLVHLSTRIYFEGEQANDGDEVLGTVPPERRDTLVARADGEAGGVACYRFDVVLQGENETVFFDL